MARALYCIAAMREIYINLLTDLHHSIDLVAEDLQRDRPDLANALRVQSAWIPRPEQIRDEPPTGSSIRACEELAPLLYEAVDAGLLDGNQFDRMMLRQIQAARALEKR
jgi:hypothetical protein